MLLHHCIKVKIVFGRLGAQMGCGGTHFACPQITRIALISKMKNKISGKC
jgi:hypothetical protein